VYTAWESSIAELLFGFLIPSCLNFSKAKLKPFRYEP
jgi:hypothetical protein